MNTMQDTKKISVEEIRNILINEYKVDIDTVNNLKGKTNLVNFMLSLDKVGSPTESSSEQEEDYGFEMVSTTPPQNDEKEVEVPSPTNPRWTEYVLNHLQENEKDGNYPKTDGLRRLVEKLVSPIVRTNVDVIQAPSIENSMVSTVKVQIGLLNGQHYEACADTQERRCIHPYNAFLSAIAETRAKGRAYREILRLQNVCAAEEIMTAGEGFSVEKINGTQKAFLTAMCDPSKLNINVKKLFENSFPDSKKSNVNDYGYEQAADLLRKLSEYQQDINKIPKEILGYDQDWRN